MQEKPSRKRAPEKGTSSLLRGVLPLFNALPKVVTEVVTTYSGETRPENRKTLYNQNFYIY
jgi:hypothetical protein